MLKTTLIAILMALSLPTHARRLNCSLVDNTAGGNLPQSVSVNIGSRVKGKFKYQGHAFTFLVYNPPTQGQAFADFNGSWAPGTYMCEVLETPENFITPELLRLSRACHSISKYSDGSPVYYTCP